MFELHQGRAQFFPYFVKVGIIYKPLVIYTLMHIHTHKNSYINSYICVYMCTHTKTYIHTHKHTYTHKPKHTYIHPKHTSTHTHTHHIYTVPHTQVKHAHRSISTHNHKFIIDIKPISKQSLCTIRYVTFSRPLRHVFSSATSRFKLFNNSKFTIRNKTFSKDQ